jgi:Na+-translocating ferredoxin:NAD+ oxidoreductase subunit A
MKTILLIIVSAVLIDNFVLSKFLGICPFLGVSRKTQTAMGMSLAVIFVMTLASAACWPIFSLLLVPLGLSYLQTIVFILVIAALVQLVETILKKFMPPLYKALGIYLPLITTNCAVLGVVLLNVLPGKTLNFFESVINGFAAGVGFTLVIIIFSGVRERIDNSDIPESMKGLPIALVAAGLFSVAFMGFKGLFAGL